MTTVRLQNIARLSALYLGCIVTILISSTAGLNENWSIAVGIAYLIIIVVLELKGCFRYFRGVAIPGAYAFISLIVAQYVFNVTRDHSSLYIFGYVMMLNFVFSCGYLIYSLHTFKPHQAGEQS